MNVTEDDYTPEAISKRFEEIVKKLRCTEPDAITVFAKARVMLSSDPLTNVNVRHRLWYGPFRWADGSTHPCPVDGSMHGE